jgi:hypothetical protein
MILEKVSFDQFLLNKEYQKCLTYLNKNEKAKLNSWISSQNFSHKLSKMEIEIMNL